MTRFQVTTTLTSLRCHEQWDKAGNSEPYMWTAFAYYSPLTGPRILAFAPEAGSSGLGLFGGDVKAGDVRPIPPAWGTHTTILDDYLDVKDDPKAKAAAVVVVMFEQDETPEDAVRAGHIEFQNSLRQNLANINVTSLKDLGDEQKQAILAGLLEPVKSAVEAGIRSALTTVQKAKILANIIDTDNFIGHTYAFLAGPQLVSGNLALPEIRGEERVTVPFPNIPGLPPIPVVRTHRYEITGRIKVDRLDPAAPPKVPI